ncbi:MAG: 50S ribosomal protein L13 [Candidatus Diapherotrites archaeon]
MEIDATNLVIGRLSTVVAQKALAGESVTIVNAEKAVITGTQQAALERYKRRDSMTAKGNPHKGPKFSRMPDRILRYAIKGMLPMRSSRGRIALRKTRVYIGIPKELKGKKFETIENAKNKSRNYQSLEDISKAMGAKW